MKKIIPEAIPELKIMPFLIGFLILFGLVAAFLKKKSLVMVWISTIVMMMIIGLYDFYIWGYDYGHDLNPEAPIKIPGMVYQPPLIGSKQLLNMNSVSLPDIGAYLIGISLLIGVFVLLNRKFIKGK
jgi:copper chaperone NosL